MFDIAVNVAAPVVGQDESHQECACSGIVIAVPDGTIKLFSEDVAELEAVGWGILAAVERIRAQPKHEHQHA